MTNICSALYNDSGGYVSAEHLDSRILPGQAKLTMTVDELAYELNISRTTAYKLTRQKDFYPALHIGHRIVVSVQALQQWIVEQTKDK